MLLAENQRTHFDNIADTWEAKGWVNSAKLNRAIQRFIKGTERGYHLSRTKHKTLLYLGIGTGVLFQYLGNYNIAGVDEAFNMLSQCPEGIIQIRSNAENLPFLMPDQFHIGMFRNLLKHCHEPQKAVSALYQKIRPDYGVTAFESVVYDEKDKEIPTRLVRMTDPDHPSFLSIDDVVALFKDAGFRDIHYELMPFRDRWLEKWVRAEKADPKMKDEIIAMYKKNKDFQRKYDVAFGRDYITSTVPWMMIRATKR